MTMQTKNLPGLVLNRLNAAGEECRPMSLRVWEGAEPENFRRTQGARATYREEQRTSKTGRWQNIPREVSLRRREQREKERGIDCTHKRPFVGYSPCSSRDRMRLAPPQSRADKASKTPALYDFITTHSASAAGYLEHTPVSPCLRHVRVQDATRRSSTSRGRHRSNQVDNSTP